MLDSKTTGKTPKNHKIMSECLHKNLVMIKESSDKVRCLHCHLTISKEELGDGYCPECYEETGRKRYEFEKVVSESEDVTKYRCENCGVIIKADN